MLSLPLLLNASTEAEPTQSSERRFQSQGKKDCRYAVVQTVELFEFELVGCMLFDLTKTSVLMSSADKATKPNTTLYIRAKGNKTKHHLIH